MKFLQIFAYKLIILLVAIALFLFLYVARAVVIGKISQQLYILFLFAQYTESRR